MKKNNPERRNDSLKVEVDGKICIISEKLLNSQDVWHNLESIKDCHRAKLLIYSVLDNLDSTKNRAEIYNYGKQLEGLEFKLQGLWGFEPNVKFHRFWEYPKCECPVMDNLDSYPFRSYISGNCPMHGNVGAVK